MSLFAAALAAGSGVSLLLSGYLFGARRGRDARATLDRELEARDAAVQALRARVDIFETSRAEVQARADTKDDLQSVVSAFAAREEATAQRLREELAQMQTAIDDRARTTEVLHLEIKTSLAGLAKGSPDAAKLHKELTRLMAPLLERDAEAKGLRETVREVIAPMLERDRLGRALADVKAGDGLSALGPVLQAIAQTGGFDTVLLSDDAGLPLAASRDAEAIEVLAGVSTLLL
ncbi:MAG: hypothetical protein ACHREM_14225, partial [Polyangiales bacterium]